MRKIFIGFLIFFCYQSYAYSNEVISKITKNWNETQSMSGNFLQVDSDGIISEGKFYFLKPFQSKFEYSDKSENIITNQRLLRIVDDEGYQIDSYPLGNNILKKILSNDIQLEKELNIQYVRLNGDDYELNIKLDKETTTDQAIFFFDKNSLDLKKWEIIDGFENKTVLEFTKIKKNIFISENLFVVKYK